jgi:hypothetical protein
MRFHVGGGNRNITVRDSARKGNREIPFSDELVVCTRPDNDLNRLTSSSSFRFLKARDPHKWIALLNSAGLIPSGRKCSDT